MSTIIFNDSDIEEDIEGDDIHEEGDEVDEELDDDINEVDEELDEELDEEDVNDEEDTEEDIQFESEEEVDEELEEDFEETGVEGIDPAEFYDDQTKKAAKAIFNRRKRTKPPKVSKTIKKKKKTQDEIVIIQNYMSGNIREKSIITFEKIIEEKNCKLLERTIFNHIVRKTEVILGRKLKKSDLDNEIFRSGYIAVVYETFVSMSSGIKCSEQIQRLSENKSGLSSYDFRNEYFVDTQETKNIEEPPKAKPGIHTCSKCLHDKDRKHDADRGKRTWCYELQTRSCDEPMTQFITCLDCGKKWKQ